VCNFDGFGQRMRAVSAQPWLLKKSFTPLVRAAKTVLL
jgi:hypothetical protein